MSDSDIEIGCFECDWIGMLSTTVRDEVLYFCPKCGAEMSQPFFEIVRWGDACIVLNPDYRGAISRPCESEKPSLTLQERLAAYKARKR